MAVEILYNIKNITEKYSIANKVPVFATQEYADYLFVSKNIRTIWFINEVKGQIIFIIPLAIERKYIFKKGYFLTAVNKIDIVHFENEKKFLDDVIDIIKKYKLCDWIQQPPNWAIFNEVPSNSIYCEYGTYRTNLEINSENELNSKLQHEARRLIKKAISNNIIIKSGQELIEDCSSVFSKASYNGNQTLPTRKEIEKLLEKLSDHIQIYISYYNSVPQSCVIFYSNQYCLYAVYAGLIPSSINGVNHLLYWEAIKDAKKRGIKYFDFVGARIKPLKGSKQEYIQRFKKDFGGELVKGFLWKYSISKSKYSLYKIIIRGISFISKKKSCDIIDEEIARKKIKEIVLTYDYELFLGEKTGTVNECMIEPTDKIISFLKKNNSKMTVFWDVLHYYRLLQYEKKFPELLDDRLLIEKQILDLTKDGHDVQLHLHTHWLDAKYENGKWIFQYDRFKLHSLKKESNIDDINTIIGCISISKKIIENIVRKVNPDYETTTFRAGGYLIEPFNEINEAFIANNIKIDSSVCPGLYNKNGQNTYDFRDYPLKQKYNFNITPKKIVESGHYVELPITTIKLSLFRNIYYKLLKKIKYSSLENERKGKGINSSSKISNNTITKKIISILFGSHRSQFTTDLSFQEKFNYIFNKVPDHSVMIMHPKLLNSHTLKIIDDYLSANKLHFISIKDNNF